jgi:hypothetical protein
LAESVRDIWFRVMDLFVQCIVQLYKLSLILAMELRFFGFLPWFREDFFSFSCFSERRWNTAVDIDRLSSLLIIFQIMNDLSFCELGMSRQSGISFLF